MHYTIITFDLILLDLIFLPAQGPIIKHNFTSIKNKTNFLLMFLMINQKYQLGF